jgi:DNA-binding winged helix-turn-helix (wHTH) protein/Tfp pilus assembly protein PilF
LLEKLSPSEIVVGTWRAVRATGELTRNGATERLEPKVMDLLFLLASRPGAAFSKDDIMDSLWPNVTVGDDTLARAVSRLRKALADDAKTPAYIETLPKRGYRLIAEVKVGEGAAPVSANILRRSWAWPVAGAALCALVIMIAALTLRSLRPPAATGTDTLVERANDFYFQYKRADNEAAIALFERILTDRPDHAPALAGLANALVQRVIRWPNEPGAPEYTKLADALKSGRTKTAAAQQLLTRARVLAERAVAVAPEDPATHKALGFVHGALADFPAAIASYERAIALDADAWGPLINIGDVLEISNRSREALPYFERAYAAMTRVYDKQAARVRPWYAELGVLIADRHKDAGDLAEAESWYRRVLVYAPLHRTATEQLAVLLRMRGDIAGADSLCANFKQRAGIACGG